MSIYEDFNTGLSEDEMLEMALAMSDADHKSRQEERLATIKVLKIAQDQEYQESLRKDQEKELLQELQEDDYDYEADEPKPDEPKEGDITALRLARLKFFDKK